MLFSVCFFQLRVVIIDAYHVPYNFKRSIFVDFPDFDFPLFWSYFAFMHLDFGLQSKLIKTLVIPVVNEVQITSVQNRQYFFNTDHFGMRFDEQSSLI